MSEILIAAGTVAALTAWEEDRIDAWQRIAIGAIGAALLIAGAFI